MLWGTDDDLDLHVITPNDKHIFYSNRTADGGTLDVDANARSIVENPVENIYFPEPPEGHYKVYIKNYRDRTSGQATHYLVRLIVNGETRVFEGDIDSTGTEVVIVEFDYVRQGQGGNQPLTDGDLDDWRARAGAGDGDITVTLIWGNFDDVDLHMSTPDESHIYYSNKTAGGGMLDVDANAGGGSTMTPVENIYFAAPQNGHYKVWINMYSDRTEGPTEYLVRVTVGGDSQTFRGTIDTSGTDIDIIEFDYGGATAGLAGDAQYNGHRYGYYEDNGSMSWSQARDYCVSLGGHLVTITSAEEQQFISMQYAGKDAWIGLYGGGGWNWVTGEAVEYTNWRSAQPDNANGDEWFCHMWGGAWNDLNNEDSTYHYHQGFICEWDSLADLSESGLNEALGEAGAQAGAITISIMWDSEDDLDLHVFTPSGAEIYWNRRSADGGYLDVDANSESSNLSEHPVENVYFTEPELNGEYWVYVYDYADRSDRGTSWFARVTVGGQSQVFDGVIDGSGTSVQIMGFQYNGAPSGN